MKINDARKPYQCTVGKADMKPGCVYELVSGNNDDQYGRLGDLYLAAATAGAQSRCDYAVNLTTGAALYGLLGGCRFIPVEAEVTIK